MTTLQTECFDALLFDLDGTLANSMDLHNQAWIDTLQDLGCSITHETLQSIERVQPISPVLKIVQNNYRRKPLAIVSGGSKDLVERILNVLQIRNLFSVKVCAEDTLRSKPHPDPFLHAAQLLKVRPERRLVWR